MPDQGAACTQTVACGGCKLLVDHLSSRGVWRGVNRTSILVHNAVLASITIAQRPPRPAGRCGRGSHRSGSAPAKWWPGSGAKHMRHAAFSGTRDNLSGSSANVLTGGSIAFGTNGMSLLLNVHHD
jgi:hypothetical protein